MPSVTVTKISKEPDGRILVDFSHGEGREFASLADMKSVVRSNLTRDDLVDIAIALMLSRQPTLANPAAFVGHSVNVDFSAANWGTVT